jgi:amino acid transporter
MTRKIVMSEKSVFIRKTSGLVRPYGATDTVLIYTLIIFSILNTTLQFPWFFGFWPGADLVGALAVAMIPMGLLMICYWAIALAMPRSGSDYVWFARIGHPSIGFAWSAVYYYMLLVIGPLTVCFTYGFTISISLVAWGTLYNAPGLVAFATWLNTTDGTFVFAFVIFTIYSAFAILGHKLGKALLYTGWVIQVVALLLMWAIMGTSNPTVFAQKWDTLMSSYITYQAVFDTAKSAGWVLAPVTLGATVSSVTFTFMLMSGAAQGAGTISGEIRNVNRSIPLALLFSNLFAFIIWSISALAEIQATGYNWLVALSWMWDTGTKYPLPWPPSMPLMLGILTYPNQMLTLVALGTFVLANIAFAYILIVTISRYFFAWAFDRLIPTKFADVSARFKTPHSALVATWLIAVVTAYFYSYVGFSNFFAAGSTLMVLCYAVLACTVVVFPFTKWKTLLDQLPTFMRKRIGLPVISWVGLATAIFLFYAAYAVTVNPLLTGTAAPLTAYLFGGIFILGIVIYYVSKAYHARQGIDIGLIFKEVPPT